MGGKKERKRVVGYQYDYIDRFRISLTPAGGRERERARQREREREKASSLASEVSACNLNDLCVCVFSPVSPLLALNHANDP